MLSCSESFSFNALGRAAWQPTGEWKMNRGIRKNFVYGYRIRATGSLSVYICLLSDQ